MNTDPPRFPGMYLLYPKGGIYGNSTIILKKYGRLVLTWESSVGVTCYVLNTPSIRVSSYHLMKLREECLAGRKSCADAFGIQDVPLELEPGLDILRGVDGSVIIRFNDPPIELKQCQEFYKVLANEMRTSVPSKEKRDVNGSDEDFVVFFDMVDYLSESRICSAITVYVYSSKDGQYCGFPRDTASDYDAVVDIERGGVLLNSIPMNWEVVYDARCQNIECNPLIRRLGNSLRPIVPSIFSSGPGEKKIISSDNIFTRPG